VVVKNYAYFLEYPRACTDLCLIYKYSDKNRKVKIGFSYRIGLTFLFLKEAENKFDKKSENKRAHFASKG